MDEARKIAQKAIKNGINNQKIFKITQAIQERSKVKINAEIVKNMRNTTQEIMFHYSTLQVNMTENITARNYKSEGVLTFN